MGCGHHLFNTNQNARTETVNYTHLVPSFLFIPLSTPYPTWGRETDKSSFSADSVNQFLKCFILTVVIRKFDVLRSANISMIRSETSTRCIYFIETLSQQMTTQQFDCKQSFRDYWVRGISTFLSTDTSGAQNKNTFCTYANTENISIHCER